MPQQKLLPSIKAKELLLFYNLLSRRYSAYFYKGLSAMPSITELLKKMRTASRYNEYQAANETDEQANPIFGVADCSSRSEGNAGTCEEIEDNTRYRTPSHTELVSQAVRAKMKNDSRVHYMDVDNIDLLTARYQKEFNRADKIMELKKNNKSLVNKYVPLARPSIPKDDKAFKQWCDEEKYIEQWMELHWMDKIIDHPIGTFMYTVRFCTTFGGIFGLGRGIYIIRTMDKVYAKLHGVSSFDVVLRECSLNIVRGLFVAAAGCIGLQTGKLLTQLGSTFVNSTPSYPRRTWMTFVLCGFCSSVGVLPVFYYYANRILTKRGVKLLAAVCTLTGTAIGAGCGYFIYRPFALKRLHDPYDMHWRPWYEREMWKGAETGLRGRYV